MKKICKAMVLAAVSAFLLAGCTKGFENMNKNVYGVSDEQMAQDGLALGGMLQQLERSVIVFRDGTYLDSDYQIMYNLCAETWCALLRGLGLACLIWPAVMLLVLLHRLRSGGVKEAKRLWAAGKERLLDLRDRRRAHSMARSEKS